MSSEQGGAQQRQFYRAAVDFAVRVLVAEEEAAVPARAHDLSGAGIRISMERELDRGTPLELRFHLPHGKTEIVAHGTVVLSFFEGSSNHYHHGVAFTRIGAADREAIVHYIHDVQRRSLTK